jgi:hypothetical protein
MVACECWFAFIGGNATWYLRNTLERLAEAAEASGLVDDERYALTQLVRLNRTNSVILTD